MLSNLISKGSLGFQLNESSYDWNTVETLDEMTNEIEPIMLWNHHHKDNDKDNEEDVE